MNFVGPSAVVVGAALLAWIAGWIKGEALAVLVLAGVGCFAWMRWRPMSVRTQLAATWRADRGSADPGALGDRLPYPALLLAPDGRVEYANPEARQLLAGLALGSHVHSALRSPEFAAQLDDAVRSGSWAEVAFDLGERRERPFRAWIRPGRGSPGRTGARDVLVCIEDRTQFQRSQSLHRDFVANASHELRTPLSTAAICIETLRGSARGVPVAARRCIDLLDIEVRRMHGIVSDLLSLNAIEMQEHVRPAETVDLTVVVREAMAAYPASLAEHAELHMPEEGLHIRGARAELVQAVCNLLANAERHADGATGVTVRALNGKAELQVADRGPGIAPEHLPRLTERFYRADPPAGRQSVAGAGLGLAIVKHVISRHEGELAIDSELGAGTRVCLRFELVQAPFEPDSG